MECKGTTVLQYIPANLIWFFSVAIGVATTLLFWAIFQQCRTYYGPITINKLTFKKYKYATRLLVSD